MKRLMVLIACVMLLMGTVAFAAETPAATSEQAAPAVGAPSAATTAPAKMNASGKITELSDTILIIQRVVKGNAELMEFSLEKPIKFKVGDKVKVSYIEKDGTNIATKVSKVYKTAKAAKPAPAKQTPAASPTPAPAPAS